MAKATTPEMANMITYCTGWLRQSRMPKMPVTPVPAAASPTMEANMAPRPPPMQPATKGLKKRRLTPKMAGSVIPMKAESEEGRASERTLTSLVLRATARAAPAWPMLAALASGSQ